MGNHSTNVVVVGLIVRDDRVFIARRAATKTTFAGRFELLGGHVELGEGLEEALRREIKEEIALDVRVGDLVGAFLYKSENILKVELGYLCYPLDPTIEPQLNPVDHSEGLWISAEEINRFEKNDEEAMILQKAFEKLERSK